MSHPDSSVLTDLVQALAAGTIRIIDLTMPLHANTAILPLPPQWPNTPRFALHEISRYDERGPFWYWNWFETGEHTGTHFDAPIHWASGKDIPDGTVDCIDPRKFVGPACVIDVTSEADKDPDFLLSPSHVQRWASVGTDAGQAAFFDTPFCNHFTMHGHNKFGLASLCNLDQLPSTGAVVIAAPLKIVGGSGSPVRAIALTR